MAWADDNLGRRRNPGFDPRDQLHDAIFGLRGHLHQLRQVAQHIDTDTRSRNELLNQLEESVAEGWAGLNTTTRRLNRALAQRGISPLYLAIGFALLCFFLVYL